MTLLTIFSFDIVMFASIFCGVFLAYHTCEELVIIEKILNVMKYIFSIGGFFIIDYLLFGFGVTSILIGIGILILAVLMYGIRKYYSISKNEFIKIKKIAEMLTLSALMCFFAIRDNPVLASDIFLLGLVIGTIETKRYLFAAYDHNKFTTLTTFSPKEIFRFYLNALKEYHWALYPAIVVAIFTMAI